LRPGTLLILAGDFTSPANLKLLIGIAGQVRDRSLKFKAAL